MEKVIRLYRDVFGAEPVSALPLAGGGGNRRYWRLEADGKPAAVGVAGDSLVDCRAFVALSRAFGEAGLPVPGIYAVSDDGISYLEEDLGDVSLFSLLGSAETESLVEESLRALARMQCSAPEVWREAVAYAPFSRRQAMWDLNYFKYEFLRPSGVDFDEDALENDFGRMADALLSGEVERGFMFRDFQSRNVMICGGRPIFIDYQGGREGPLLYDAVSFLWQAKAGFSDEFRQRMLRAYASEVARLRPGTSAESLLAGEPLFALFRTLQVLGAYGFRGLVEKRAHFIESIPPALANLRKLVESGAADPFPALRDAALSLAESPRFRRNLHDGLLVKVFSFSYKRGYPEDFTGNGGGFIFDCRGMHNPGRYEEYRPLTGRDRPVMDFLKERGEAEGFADNAFALVRPTVDCYLRRGFSDLQVGFGCTGGRHRSVFCAERFARALKREYPDLPVMLVHREQDITESL